MEKNKRKNYTQISNYFIDNWHTMKFTPSDMAIMCRWLRGQNFYVWHDDDLGNSSKTVQRWRENMLIKGYCISVELIKDYNSETKQWYTKGYKYDFTPLLKLLDEKDGNISTDNLGKQQDNLGKQQDNLSGSYTEMSTHTNTISQDYSQDYSSTAATTSSAKAVKEHASVPVPAVAGGIENLYHKYLPEVKIRKSDRLALDKLDQEKLVAYIPYLPYFDDPFWNSSTSTKQPSMLPAVWQALEKFVEGFPYSSAFHTACKQLKKSGIDVDQIIESAENNSIGKQILINIILKGETE